MATRVWNGFTWSGGGGVARAVWNKTENLAVSTGNARLPFTENARLLGVKPIVKDAPTGADIILDLNLNGTSVFAAGNRPRILAGQVQGTEANVFNNSTVAVGDYLTLDIDQVGSSTPGAWLTVVVTFEYL